MTPVKTPMCNVNYVAEGCFDLPAMTGKGGITTWWQPDAEELEILNRGGAIQLSLLTDGCPPTRLDAVDLA